MPQVLDDYGTKDKKSPVVGVGIGANVGQTLQPTNTGIDWNSIKNALSNITQPIGNAVSNIYNNVGKAYDALGVGNNTSPSDINKPQISTPPPQAASAPQLQQYVQYQPNPSDLNAQLVAAQRAAKLAGLQKAYDGSLSQLNQQDALIDPQAYNDRATKSTASQLSAKNFAEFLANRNQTNSGFADQSELNRNMQLQGDIGAIDLQSRNAHNNIATKKTDLYNALQSDIAGANAGIEADSLQRQIQLAQQEQSRQDQLNQFAKTYGLNLAQLTGTINGQSTLAKQQLDNQQTQQAFENSMSQANFDEAKAKNAFDMKMAQLGYDKSVSDTAWNQQMQERQFNWDTDKINNPALANQVQQMQIDKAQFNEWQKQAPQRLQLLNAQVKQATDESTLNSLKAQAQQLENQLASVNLKYAPAQAQQQINESKAQIANIYNEISNRNKQLAINQQKVSNSKTKADDSKLTAKQKADLKTKAYSLAAAANMGETPSQDQVDNLYDYLVGGENPTASTQQPQAYAPANQITDQATRQRWYTDNKAEIDKSMTSDQLTAFKTKFGLK